MKSLLGEGFLQRELLWLKGEKAIKKAISDETAVARSVEWNVAFRDYVECLDYCFRNGHPEDYDKDGYLVEKKYWTRKILSAILVSLVVGFIAVFAAVSLGVIAFKRPNIIAFSIGVILITFGFLILWQKRVEYWVRRADERLCAYECVWPNIEKMANDWMNGGDFAGSRDAIPKAPHRRTVYVRPPITICDNRPFREGENEGGGEVTDAQDQSQVAEAAEQEEVSGPETDGDVNPGEVTEEKTDDPTPVKVDEEVSFDTDSASTGCTYDPEAAKELDAELKYLDSPDKDNSESDADTVSKGENTPGSKTEEVDSERDEDNLADEEDVVPESEDGDSESENLNLEHINKALDDVLGYFKETLNDLRGA